MRRYRQEANVKGHLFEREVIAKEDDVNIKIAHNVPKTSTPDYQPTVLPMDKWYDISDEELLASVQSVFHHEAVVVLD
jgi:hypothetical protein